MRFAASFRFLCLTALACMSSAALVFAAPTADSTPGRRSRAPDHFLRPGLLADHEWRRHLRLRRRAELRVHRLAWR